MTLTQYPSVRLNTETKDHLEKHRRPGQTLCGVVQELLESFHKYNTIPNGCDVRNNDNSEN